MTIKEKNLLNLKTVFLESWQMFRFNWLLIIICPLVFTPIGVAIEMALGVIPVRGIHYMVSLGLNFVYIAFLVLVHFAYLYALVKRGSWKTVFHAMLLDDMLTMRQFLNYFLVNLKLMLIMLLPSILIIYSYEDTSMHKGLSLGLFLMAALLSSAISAKFAFGLVLQVYGAGTRKERSLRLISAFSQPCYTKLVILEFIITVLVYLPKWGIAFFLEENQLFNYAFENYIVIVINFMVSIWIVKAYEQLYRKSV